MKASSAPRHRKPSKRPIPNLQEAATRMGVCKNFEGVLEFGMYQDEFVVEEADDSTIPVRHLLAGCDFYL